MVYRIIKREREKYNFKGLNCPKSLAKREYTYVFETRDLRGQRHRLQKKLPGTVVKSVHQNWLNKIHKGEKIKPDTIKQVANAYQKYCQVYKSKGENNRISLYLKYFIKYFPNHFPEKHNHG